MYSAPKELILSNGMICTVKSPLPSDARNMMMYLKEVAKETSYMVRYKDEIGQSYREWALRLKNAADQEGTLILCVFSRQKIIASANLCRISSYRKVSHRCSVSVSVLKEVWHFGLGRTLIQEMIQFATESGFSQMELEVACDNINAITLYLSFGFQIYGKRKNAYYIEGNGFLDEYLMSKELKP